MLEHSYHALRYFTFNSFPNGTLVHAVFARSGGVSPQPFASLNMSISTGDTLDNTRANRKLAFDALNVPFDSMMDVWQVHGTDVVCADSPRGEREAIKADGVTTNKHGVTLFQRFADCVPIILYDPIQRAIGIVHAGWKGTISGAAASLVKAMNETYSCQPRHLIAGIAPSICADHYEVGDEVVTAVRGAFKNSDEVLIKKGERYHFDLWAANRIALQEAGVEQIEVAGICTSCRNDLFFSHRAEQGKTGRFGALIALR
ncbi:MAG: peptidoglycan editing factor PgeF [Chloroflexi bacterium]|nr:peptidoglycan editing factor PgeF [Chloroflexota bacterium]